MSSNESPFKAILVDLFDTTIYCPWGQIRRRLALSAGVPVQDFLKGYSRTQATRNIGAYGSDLRDMQEISQAAKLDLAEGDISCLVQLERKCLLQYGEYYPDVRHFLESIHQAGLITGAVSNCSYGAETLINRLHVRKIFGQLFLSFEVGHRKPDPQAYRQAAEQMNIAPQEILFIDDQPSFCAGATAAGMSALLIKRNPADHKAETGNLPYISELHTSVLTKTELFFPTDYNS